MSIANYLTFTRIFLSPFFLFLYLEHDFFNISLTALPYFLLFFLAISESSDLLDGYLARKYNQVTDFGKILDPMADSIYRLSVFLTFTLPPVNLPMILIFIFLYRDSVTSTLRIMCALKGFVLAARPSGKLKAVIQGITALIIILLLIPQSLGYISIAQLQSWSMWIVSFAAAYSLLSLIDYIYGNREYIKKIIY